MPPCRSAAELHSLRGRSGMSPERPLQRATCLASSVTLLRRWRSGGGPFLGRFITTIVVALRGSGCDTCGLILRLYFVSSYGRASRRFCPSNEDKCQYSTVTTSVVLLRFLLAGAPLIHDFSSVETRCAPAARGEYDGRRIEMRPSELPSGRTGGGCCEMQADVMRCVYDVLPI